MSAVRSDEGFWSRDAHRFLRVRQVSEANALAGVEVYEFDADGRLRLFLAAARAEVGTGRQWVLGDVIEKTFGADGPTTRRLPRRTWESFIDREQVGLLALPPASLGLSDLYRYIVLLRARGQTPVADAPTVHGTPPTRATPWWVWALVGVGLLGLVVSLIWLLTFILSR